jgi:hypothetical protein
MEADDYVRYPVGPASTSVLPLQAAEKLCTRQESNTSGAKESA